MDSLIAHGCKEVTSISRVPSTRNIFVSCGEDGSVRYWDHRCNEALVQVVEIGGEFPQANLSEVTALTSSLGCVIAERVVTAFDTRMCGDAASAKPALLCSYRHPNDLEVFGMSFAMNGQTEAEAPPIVSILDEDGTVLTLRAETLRLSAAPFGRHKNIGCGLCTSNEVVVSAAMDNEVHLYHKDENRRFMLASSIGVDIGALSQQVNPPIASSLDISWPYCAVGRGDGAYVVLEVVTSSEENPGMEMEFVLSSAGSSRCGLCSVLWQPESLRLCSVSLVGEVALWNVEQMFGPVPVAADSSDGADNCTVDETPECLFRADIHARDKMAPGIVNTATFLTPDILVAGDSAGRISRIQLHP